MDIIYYAVRLAKNGPRCGLKVLYGVPNDPVTGEPLDRSPRWQCWLNDESVEPWSVIMELDGVTQQPVINGELIDEAEYKYLCDVSQWASAHAPDSPEANPRRPIDLAAMKPIF